MEDWNYHDTYSGTPQGGIISPLLANIYLHELDKFIGRLKQEFDKPSAEKSTPEYKQIQNKLYNVRRRIPNAKNEGLRQALIAEHKEIRKEMLKTPAKSQTDKKIVYVRYADDFLIGVNGNAEDCKWIKAAIAGFMRDTLKMELSEEKTLITHSSQYARFLGYDVRVRRNGEVKPSGMGFTKRTLNNKVELAIPLNDKIRAFLFANKVVEQDSNGKMVPVHRKPCCCLTDLETVSAYNAELRGLCNYYQLAMQFHQAQLFYLSDGVQLPKNPCSKAQMHDG